MLSADDSPVQHHLYLQPYVRSSHLVRLLSSPPDGPTRANTNVGDDHSSLIAIRMREWYAEDDDLTATSDVLEISVDGGDAGRRDHRLRRQRRIGLHIHDDAATPGETTLEPLPVLRRAAVPERHRRVPAGIADGRGTITVTNLPRGDADHPQTLNVPNWPSSGHAISVVFTDWPVDAPDRLTGLRVPAQIGGRRTG